MVGLNRNPDKELKKYRFKRVISDGNVIENGLIIIRGENIEEVGSSEHSDFVDYSDYIAVPGFIDIHTHGMKGVDTYNLDSRSLETWSAELLKTGVTGVIPSIVSAPAERIVSFLNTITAFSNGFHPGNHAVILGGRLEGPYINRERKGAHDPAYIRNPQVAEYENLFNNFSGVLKIMDVAPELNGALEMIKASRKSGISISIGHTAADFLESMDAFEAGARLVTHFYNAMNPFHHRETGVIGSGMLDERIYIELICDLKHVSREALRIALTMKTFDKVITVTDSSPATLCQDGFYKLGSLDVEKKGDECVLKGTDTIAGSVVTMDSEIRNLRNIGYPLELIIKTVTSNPARLLGLRNIGFLKPGYNANVVLLDRELKVKYVILDGEVLDVA